MSDEIKISDSEALEWHSKLSGEDRAEVRRQALLRRAIDLAQPAAPVDFGSMSDMEFETWKRRNMK